MAITAAPPVVDVPTSAFLGLVTEMDAIDLPEGSSPDNQDVIFSPGEVDSRPAAHRIFGAGATTTYTYGKTFIQPNDNPLNLYLDSAGVFWMEDVVNSPGVKTQVHNVTPGLWAQSVTAFGREFIAFSDALHGQDIPRQFDGTNFDRVTQDGPGAAPSVADINSIVAVTSVTLSNLAAIANAGVPGAHEDTNLVTITTTTPHGLKPQQFVLIYGVGVAGYNGLYQVTGVPTATTFTTVNAGVGLADSGGGNVGLGLVTVVTAANHGLSVGDAVVLSGNAGSLNNGQVGTGATNPLFWTVVQVVNATTFVFALTGPSGTVNSTTFAGGAGGEINAGGMISVGPHQVVQMFLTRMGYLTKPSPPATWVCAGNKQASVTNLAIGPSNVIARVLALTGSGGAFFFTIGANVNIPGSSLLFQGTAPATVVQSFVITDNVSTSVTIDFPDNTLFAAEAIDQPGGNLFAQRVIGPCLGFTFYAGRLGCWGEWNRVEQFLNMGFEGGILSGLPNQPLGWGTFGAGGALNAGASDFGLAWQITGDGSGNARGQLTQTAFQNNLFQPIIAGTTQYSFRLWAKASAGGLAGNAQAILSAASTGFTATAAIPIASISTAGSFVMAAFNALTPAVIPADLILTIQETGLNNGATVTLDELEIIFTVQPYLDNVAFFSYLQNPEAFDGVTGKFASDEDSNPLRFFTQLRDTLVFASSGGLHRTIDNASGEPSSWDITTISHTVGALSFRAGDPGRFGAGDTGEEWIAIASYAGLYLYGGGPLWKVSQENQPLWDRINYAAAQTLWVKNVPGKRRIHMGLPLDQSTAPNLQLVMDYRELDTDQQIAGAPSVRISMFSGKMFATDMARKWTRWNLAANFGELLARPNSTLEFCIGAGNGVTPGQMNGFGNIYYFDPAKLTDDDYGAMVPYWISYFFVNHEQEMQLQLGGHRKLFVYSAYHITGVGNLVVTPYSGAVTNPYPASAARQLSSTLNNDIEIPLNVPGSRVAFKIAVNPLQGQTDVQFKLSKMIISIRKHPMSPLRGAR